MTRLRLAVASALDASLQRLVRPKRIPSNPPPPSAWRAPTKRRPDAGRQLAARAKRWRKDERRLRDSMRCYIGNRIKSAAWPFVKGAV